MIKKTDENTFEYLYEIFDETELTDLYKKYKGKEKYLAEVKTAGEKEYAPKVAVLAAIVPYIDAAAGITRWRDFKKTDILPECDKAAQLLNRASLMEFIRQNTDIAKNTDWLYPYCRYASEREISELCALKKKNKTLPDEIYYTKKLPLGALMLSDTKSAVSELYYAGFYFRDLPLNDYAKMRGMSYDSIVDEVLPDLGLDEKGEKEFDLGSFKARVSLTKDFKLSLYNEKAKKYMKSVPKRGADPDNYEAAEADFAELKCGLKRARKTKTDILFEFFLDAHEWNSEDWKKAYLKNPLNRQLAELLMWEQNGNTFTVNNGRLTDSAGNKTALTDEPIKLAHPMEMEKADLEAWKKYLSVSDVKQPFAQILEPVRDPNTIKEDRYSKIELPTVWFIHKEKHGIEFHVHMKYSPYLSFSQCDVSYHFIRSAKSAFIKDKVHIYSFKFDKYTRRINHIAAFLDLRTLYERTKKDDITVAEILEDLGGILLQRCTNIAINSGAKNLTAKLLEMKKECFPEYDGTEEFTIGDWDEEN